ncbi:MAG: helix-hairpin-helix domain-containing protein [Myxococcota bacterium]|nr:helix-hairpin-helix domain-containing protein [Myxococcota bacterium]
MSRWLGVASLLWALALSSTSEAAEPKARISGVVNLNHATAAQLDLLPGVGEKAAKLIIAYRAQQPFKRIEDLVKVKGFGKKRFERLRPHLTVSGQTTVQVLSKAQARTPPPRR